MRLASQLKMISDHSSSLPMIHWHYSWWFWHFWIIFFNCKKNCHARKIDKLIRLDLLGKISSWKLILSHYHIIIWQPPKWTWSSTGYRPGLVHVVVQSYWKFLYILEVKILFRKFRYCIALATLKKNATCHFHSIFLNFKCNLCLSRDSYTLSVNVSCLVGHSVQTKFCNTWSPTSANPPTVGGIAPKIGFLNTPPMQLRSYKHVRRMSWLLQSSAPLRFGLCLFAFPILKPRLRFHKIELIEESTDEGDLMMANHGPDGSTRSSNSVGELVL